MRLRVRKSFFDVVEHCWRREGAEFEVSEERLTTLQEILPDFIEEVAGKKSKNKAKEVEKDELPI